MKKIKLLVVPALFALGLVSISSCGENPPKGETEKLEIEDLGLGLTDVDTFVDMNEISTESTTLYPGQSVTLGGVENVTWSLSNDLATIDETGKLTAGEKDGSFIVIATSKENPDYKVQKAFKIHTMSSEELAKKLYTWAEGYNYTIDWTGRFIKEDGTELTKQELIEAEGSDTADSVYIFEDMAEKGNQVKYTWDAFYWKYGVDGYGNLYEGGSYNSPLDGGSVWDYNIVDGKAQKGSPDYIDGWLHYGDYKKIYTSDLSFFINDEFKVEDSNLTLSEDKSCLLYDATKDENNFRDMGEYDSDFSLPITIWGIVDSSYALQFSDYGNSETAKGTIKYDDEGFTGTFTFEDVAISLATEEFYTYEATLKIYDIGTTVIDGIDDLIAADQELIDSGLED